MDKRELMMEFASVKATIETLMHRVCLLQKSMLDYLKQKEDASVINGTLFLSDGGTKDKPCAAKVKVDRHVEIDEASDSYRKTGTVANSTPFLDMGEGDSVTIMGGPTAKTTKYDDVTELGEPLEAAQLKKDCPINMLAEATGMNPDIICKEMRDYNEMQQKADMIGATAIIEGRG